MKNIFLILGVLCIIASVHGLTLTESGGLQVFPNDTVWNIKIDNTTLFPADPNSYEYMMAQTWSETERIAMGGTYTSPAVLYPEFSNTYGIPVNIVNNTITNKTTYFSSYAQYSDYSNTYTPIGGGKYAGYSTWGYPIPFPFYTQPGGGDRHAIAINKDRKLLYEIGGYDQSDAVPYAGTIRIGSIFNLSDYRLRGSWAGTTNIEQDGQSYTLPRSGGNGVAGIPLTALLITPGELQAGEIKHAMYLTIVWAKSGTYIWPARASFNCHCSAGGYNSACVGSTYIQSGQEVDHHLINGTQYECPPYGARVRLKSSVDLSHYQANHPQAYTILKAMKEYGAIIADNSYLSYDTTYGQDRGFHLWGAGSVYIDQVKVSDIATNSPSDINNIMEITVTPTNFEFINESAMMVNVNSAQTYSAPNASFTKNKFIIMRPNSLVVNATCTNNTVVHLWNWGDGSANGTTMNATHQYTRPGVFTVNMTCSNGAGSASTSDTVVSLIAWGGAV